MDKKSYLYGLLTFVVLLGLTGLALGVSVDVKGVSVGEYLMQYYQDTADMKKTTVENAIKSDMQKTMDTREELEINDRFNQCVNKMTLEDKINLIKTC